MSIHCGYCSTTKCNDGSQLKKCLACKEVAYCSKACQRKAWGKHKSLCKKLAVKNKNDKITDDMKVNIAITKEKLRLAQLEVEQLTLKKNQATKNFEIADQAIDKKELEMLEQSTIEFEKSKKEMLENLSQESNEDVKNYDNSNFDEILDESNGSMNSSSKIDKLNYNQGPEGVILQSSIVDQEQFLIKVNWEVFASYDQTEIIRKKQDKNYKITGSTLKTDFVGLYLLNELDSNEYYNIQTDITLNEEKKGDFQMRLPSSRDGIYEFRYVTDNGTRCAGRSQMIFILKKRIYLNSLEPYPYLLLKEPNLLIYSLYIPLNIPDIYRNKEGVVNETFKEKKIELKNTNLPAKLMTTCPDTRVPTMTLDKDKLTLHILAPRKALAMSGLIGNSPTKKGELTKSNDFDKKYDYYLAPYLTITLDQQIDLDRSTISLHNGDFLAARLPFVNYSSANLSREKRSFIHPKPEELNEETFKKGVMCKFCQNYIIQPIQNVCQAPHVPWSEMLDHLVCVSPEEYKGEGMNPPKAFSGEAIEPSTSTLLIDEAYIEFDKSDIISNSINLCPKLLNVKSHIESNIESKRYHRSIECRECKNWIGYIKTEENDKDKAGDLFFSNDNFTYFIDKTNNNLHSVRLYKHCIRVPTNPSLYDTYYETGTLVGNYVDHLTKVRDCRTSVIWTTREDKEDKNKEVSDLIQITLFSSDSWIQTKQTKYMAPVLKVIYKVLRSQKPNKEYHGLRILPVQFDRIVEDLDKSNCWLPPSSRMFRNDAKMGFIIW